MWLTNFALEHRMDAPVFWRNGGDPLAEISQAAQEGNLSHRIIIATLGAAGAFLLFSGRRRLRFNRAAAALLAAYTGWLFLSAAWADDPGLTIRREISFALMLAFAAGCALRMTAHVLSVFLAGVIVINLIPGVIAELVSGTFHPLASGYRFCGTLHPNPQGIALSLAFILLCWLIWPARGLIRLALACAVPVVLAFLLLTKSRTSLISAAAAIGFSVALAVARDRRRRLQGLIAALALAAGLAGVAGLAVNSTSAGTSVLNAVRASGDEGDPGTLNGRVDLWQACLEFASERPLLGFGYGGFWSASHIETISNDQRWVISSSHSAYLDQVLSLGVPGAGLYAALLLACFSICVARFLRGRHLYGAWAAVLLFLIIDGLAESLVIMPPLLPNFVSLVIVAHVALVNPAPSPLCL
jgi:O-antigen ligase